MQKTWLALGVIVLFVGVVVLSLSFQMELNYETQLVTDSKARDLPLGQWETSGSFEEGDEMFVYFATPNTEGVPNGDAISATLMVNITDPLGSNTTFRIDYKGAPVRELNLTLEARSAGLEVDDSTFGDFNNVPEQIGGVVLADGEVHAHLWAFADHLARVYYRPEGELPYLEFYTIVPIRAFPNEYLRPIGFIVLAVGLGLLGWSVISSRRGRTVKRRST
jgi:hypothetical protein